MTALPPLAACADLEALEAVVPPPADPRVAAEVDAIRTELSAARALEHAGKYAAGRARSEPAVAARRRRSTRR